METPDSIERALARLVPGAIGDEALASMFETIDGLAAEEPGPRIRKRVIAGVFAGGLAASLAMAAAWWQWNAVPPEVVAGAVADEAPAVVLIEESARVLSAEEDQDLLAEADGSVHRMWRVEVVNEERFHDEETGSEIRVTQPRDEFVLIPVTAF